MKYFIGNIIWLRKQNGYTQETFAEVLNISRQSISKWERGEALPDIENLLELSKIYNVSIDDLINKDLKTTICQKSEVENNIQSSKNGDIFLKNNIDNNGIELVNNNVSDTNEEENNQGVAKEVEKDFNEKANKESEYTTIKITNEDNTIVVDNNYVSVSSKSCGNIVVTGGLANLINNNINKRAAGEAEKVKYFGFRKQMHHFIKQVQYFMILKEDLINFEQVKNCNSILVQCDKVVDGIRYYLYGLQDIVCTGDWLNFENLSNEYILCFSKNSQVKIFPNKHIEIVSKSNYRRYSWEKISKIFDNVYVDNGKYAEHISYNF